MTTQVQVVILIYIFVLFGVIGALIRENTLRCRALIAELERERKWRHETEDQLHQALDMLHAPHTSKRRGKAGDGAIN